MQFRRGVAASLLSLLCIAALGQTATAKWKEYIFAKDGFAITSPSAPNPHPDTQLEDATAYTVSFPTGETMTLRVLQQQRDCSMTLNQLKDGFKAGKQPGGDISSLRDISISGHPGVQYEIKINPERMSQERYCCVKGRFYIFAVSHPANQALSAEATRLLNSFRLVGE